MADNTTSSNSTAYTYTPFGQTASVAKTEGGSTTTTSFQYDAFGKRIAKTTGNKTTQSVWSGDEIFYEYVTEGSTTKEYRYFHGPAGYEGGIIDSVVYVAQVNYKGDVIGTMDYYSTEFDKHSYSDFGSTEDNEFIMPYGFSGEYTDVETGHQYLRNRYYDPATSRFTQEDNNFIDGFNLYAYCVNDPINYTDPSGNCCGFPMNWNTEVLSQPNVSITSEPGWRLCKDYHIHCQYREQGTLTYDPDVEQIGNGEIITPDENVGQDTLFIKSIELTEEEFKYASQNYLANLYDTYSKTHVNVREKIKDIKAVTDELAFYIGLAANYVPVYGGKIKIAKNVYTVVSKTLDLYFNTTQNMHESYALADDVLYNAGQLFSSLSGSNTNVTYRLVHVRTPYKDQFGLEVKLNTSANVSKRYVVNFSLNADLIESAFNEIILDMNPKWSYEKGLPYDFYSIH